MEDHNSKETPNIPEKVVSSPEEDQDIPVNRTNVDTTINNNGHMLT